MAAFQNTPWRLISGILGIMCLALMATLGILWKNSFTQQSIQPISPPGPTMETQEDSGCCSCQEKWIGYRCNCYFFSNEQKTWIESKEICASQNSSLLWLQSRDELQLMIFIPYFYWIGLSYNEEHGAWLWDDGSALSQDQLSFSQGMKLSNCIVYKPNERALDEPCTNENRYICKQQLI